MLQDQTLPINFGGGIDTKSDPKLVVAGKWLLLQNATLNTAFQAKKRNGYDVLPAATLNGAATGTLIAPQMLKNYKGELICQDQGCIWAYSPSLLVWIYKGPYTSLEISESFLYKETSISGHIDCAVLGNYALYIWSTDHLLGTISTMASVVDLSTNTTVLPPTVLSTLTPANAFTSGPRAVVLAGTTLAAIYINANQTAVVSRTLSITSTGIAFSGTENIILSGMGGASFIPTVLPIDVVGTSYGAGFVCQFGGKTNVCILNSAGIKNYQASVNQTTTNTVLPVACAADSSGNVWIYWADDLASASNTAYIRYAIYSPTGVLLAGPFSPAGLSGYNSISNITALPLSTTQQKLLFGIVYQDGTTTQTIDQSLSCVLSSAGSPGTLTQFATGVFPFSHPFTIGTANYAIFAYRGPSNQTIANQNQYATFFALDLSTGAVVARFASRIAKSSATLVGGYYVPGVPLASAKKALFACGIEFQLLATQTLVSGLVGAASVQMDFGSDRAYRATYSADVLALNGGVVAMYDGRRSSELGFHMAPELTNATSTTGGNIGPGTYTYLAVFQWTDAQGNLHESKPSRPITVTISSGSTNKIFLQVSCPYLSQKQNTNVAIYRTQTNGTTYFLVTDPVAVTLASTGNYFVTFPDTLADTSLLSRQEIYTAGSVVDNSAPPPSMIMESRINRLWMIDSENPNTLWYAKTYSPGTGLSMSALLQLQLDPKLGNPTGLCEMDDKMIVLKEQGNVAFAGDGANDVGTGASLTIPQFLPSDTGCSSLKSIILTPNGIFYKTPKGIYLLDRALQPHYIGDAVEGFNAQSITSAVMLSGVNQVWFFTDSGQTLVYDYVGSQWSTFTNQQALAATTYQGKVVYAAVTGVIYQENLAGSYLDGSTPFKVRAQTSWLALAGVQGFQRVRRIGILGDFSGASGHGVQVSAAYDFSNTFGSPVPYSFSASAGVFQYRERLQTQKCDALSLLIEEVTTGASGEWIDLTNLSLEAGIKRGLNKQGASNSVG